MTAMVRRSVLALTLAACAAAAIPACSGDAAPQVADLEQVVPSDDDAPAGLRFAGRLSGPVDLEAFRGDPRDRSEMQAAGFRSAWSALFASPDLLAFFTLSDPNADPPEDARLLTASAVLFDDPGGAERALATFADEAGAIREARELPRPSSGPGFAVAGARAGHRAASLGTAVGEIVVLVQTQGAVPTSDALRVLAEMRAAAQEQVS
jgi:hypothetical protein